VGVTRQSEGVEALSGAAAERLVESAVGVDVSESLKERAMDEAPVGISITDPSLPDNPMIYVNDAYERLTGYSREEVIGRNCRLLQGPETREEPVAEMASAVDAGEPVTAELRNYRKDGSMFWNRVDIAPILEDGEVAYFVGFQTDVTRRVLAERAARERAEELRDERTALATVLDRVDGLLDSVTDDVVRATTREELQRRVCRTVAGVDAYAFAWVGEWNPATDGIDPVVGAAGDGTELGEFDVALGPEDPVTAAVESGEVRVVDAPGEDGLHGSAWPDRYESLAAVPLAYRESTYGALAVYATEAGVFDDHEREVLGAVGRAVATGVNAVQSHRRVVADERGELEFDVTGTSFAPVTVARELDCEVAYVGAERVRPDALALLFEVSGGDPTRVSEVVSEPVSASVVAVRGDTAVVEFEVADPSLVGVLAERGVTVASVRAAPGEARLVVHAPGDVDPRSVADAVADHLPGAELVAVRHEPSAAERAGAGDPDLTDRQQAVLRRAHASGYFESPRAVSGEELAESMGLAPATFHQHLRAALRKVTESAVHGDDRPLDST
jgi:PAS domain S-box-containing protein